MPLGWGVGLRSALEESSSGFLHVAPDWHVRVFLWISAAQSPHGKPGEALVIDKLCGVGRQLACSQPQHRQGCTASLGASRSAPQQLTPDWPAASPTCPSTPPSRCTTTRGSAAPSPPAAVPSMHLWCTICPHAQSPEPPGQAAASEALLVCAADSMQSGIIWSCKPCKNTHPSLRWP